MAAIEPDALGYYIAEADLTASGSRASRSFDADSWSRMQALRQDIDPDGLFHDVLTPRAAS